MERSPRPWSGGRARARRFAEQPWTFSMDCRTSRGGVRARRLRRTALQAGPPSRTATRAARPWRIE
jgi:hypothetical protein